MLLNWETQPNIGKFLETQAYACVCVCAGAFEYEFSNTYGELLLNGI